MLSGMSLFALNTTQECSISHPEYCSATTQKCLSLGLIVGTYLALFCIGLLLNRHRLNRVSTEETKDNFSQNNFSECEMTTTTSYVALN